MVRPLLLDAFFAAAGAAGMLLGSSEVADRWADASALDGYTVGGLAGHMYQATRRLEVTLDEPPPETERMVGVAAYYGLNKVPAGARALDDDVQRMIRDGGEQAAGKGAQALCERFRDLVARLRERLPEEKMDRPVSTVRVEDGATTLEDYLATRVVELVVHTDDLAVSVGMEQPLLPAPAADVVFETLLGVARHQHGDVEVLRALTRQERSTPDVLRVF
jgi:uncharacterized protein (TIGR03083 family)